MSEPDLDPALRADLAGRLASALDFDLAVVRPLATGSIITNRLFHLGAADGREAVAKVYYRGDHRGRLEREYAALARLYAHGIARVPAPLLRCDEHYYAVYSLVPGAPAPAATYTPAHGADLARFAADLQRLRRAGDHDPLPTARGALVALADRARDVMRGYLAGYRAVIVDPAAPAAVLALHAELDPPAEIERLLGAATAGAGPAWHDALASDQLRLTTGDAGPHNVLLRPDDGVTVVDLESSGWDHPLAFPTDFLTHDQSLDLPPPVAAAFLDTYRAETDLADELWAEIDRACALRHVFWCAIHLLAATPDVLARRRFNNPGFDQSAHVEAQIAKFRRRLAVARDAVARLA